MIEAYQLITLLGLGFILGLEHALDPDHVAAVTTFVSRTKSLKKSSMLGAIWGLGHTFTLFLVGLLVLVLKISIPDKIALSFEFLVAVVLILLGADVLRKVFLERKRLSTHLHGILEHKHFNKGDHEHKSRTFLVGLIHGLAGSAALLLLVLATVDSLITGLVFIAVFGIGSLAGMFFVSSLIGIPFKFSSSTPRINFNIRLIAGILSVILGIILFYQVGFIEGLFF